jgi:dTDP-4-amino-4,6-dideoxygalactose transaminase
MKRIESPRDLAIHGAPPAFPRPLHVGRPNLGTREAFFELANRMFDRAWLTNDGPMVQELEARIAAFLNVRHCVAMCNGTVALQIAIRALDLSGEVIVPSFTFIATAHALDWLGITPVFADLDPTTYNLDPVAVARMITPRTTGILGVHLWGRGAPVEALQAVAGRHGLSLLFDAAHAFGCSHGGRMIGGFGRAEVLSFHATKFFNTFEGGAVVTDDDALAAKMRLMRNFGFAGYDHVVHPGTNGKMAEISAAMGLVGLEALSDLVKANRERYEAYHVALDGLDGVELLSFDPGERHNYQYVVVEVDGRFPAGRDEIVRSLHAENILARRYFWPGCHRMEPYRHRAPAGGFRLPHTERLAERVVVLPTGPALPDGAIQCIADVFRQLASASV